MTVNEFIKVWQLLKKQVKKLNVLWLEEMSGIEKKPFKILISCLLSLRTQDKTTGEASKRLFALASRPEDMASLSLNEIQNAIYPAGFYKIKAKRIKALSETITKQYHGKVPNSIDELLKLKGVGRKTANLVITLGFNQYGICVDTHVHRIVNRWGLVKTKTPVQTEFALRKILPIRYWKELNSILVAFGQGICKPVSPLCSQCKIRLSCDRIGIIYSR